MRPFYYMDSTKDILELGGIVRISKPLFSGKRAVVNFRKGQHSIDINTYLYGFKIKSLKENYVGERSYSPPAY